MISAFAGGAPGDLAGMTGVTRLIDTGALTVTMPFGAIVPLPGVVTVTITVPVNVPFGRLEGSAKAVRSTPSGGNKPLAGSTRMSHGLLSTAAVNGRLTPGNPGTCTGLGTSVLVPTGTPTFGFVVGTAGMTTTRTVTEFAPVPQA